jgi:hypothetical protein
MGFRHVVMFQWRTDVPSGQVEAALEGLRVWGEQAAQYASAFSLGTDAGINQGNYDAVVVADFADRDAYLGYRDDERHQAMIKEHILPTVAARSAVQYEL